MAWQGMAGHYRAWHDTTSHLVVVISPCVPREWRWSMTTAHVMSDLQTRALAAFIHESRPDWDAPGIVAALRAQRDHVDAWTLAIAYVRGAADPANRTPAAPRYANNRCWDLEEHPTCTIHGRVARRADTGECGGCYADRIGAVSA